MKNVKEKIEYSNSIQITHSKEEFILDFLFVTNDTESILISRIITSPRNLKKILNDLKKNMKMYRREYQKK